MFGCSDHGGVDITAEDYLQRLMQRGFMATAAAAHLVREVREGYIESDIPVGFHILVEPDGRFFVEPAVGPPAPIRNYRCRERSHAERLDYLHERDRQLVPGRAGRMPSRAAQDVEPPGEQQPAAAPGVKTSEVVDEEVSKPSPMATAAEEPFKTEQVKAMRQQGTLKLAIAEWLLKDMTRSTPAGKTPAEKQILSADYSLYCVEFEKKFPGASRRELRRALLDARQLLGSVKQRPQRKQTAQSKRQPKQS